MELSSSNLRIIIIWYTLLVASLIDSTRTLQIFNGTLTEITCSAAVPAYRLVDQEIVYDSYAQLPDLFGIEARPSPTGNNVILYINGTNRSNNVTVMCANTDLSLGFSNPQFHILFTVILEFVGILPAPNNVYYIEDPPGYLQILWEPPILDSDELDLQNISIKRDARIIHYTIYITTEESTIVQVYNASVTSFTIGIDKIPCSFWFQVAAVNPAGVGERSPPQNLTFDPHTECVSFTSSTVIEAIPASSGIADDHDEPLNYYTWAISATTIAALLAVVCIILATCLFTLLKIYRNGINRHSKTTEKEIEMKQNEVYGINTRQL